MTFSVPQHGAGDPNVLGTAGHMGDLYVDETSGDIYMHGGSSWVAVKTGGVTTGPGDPITTNPTTGEAGDIYIDESTGDIYTYNITTGEWENQSDVVSTDGGNIIVEGTDGLAYLSAMELGLYTGTGAPTATSPTTTPEAGDIYVDESTGDIYTYDGTEWVRQSGQLSSGNGDPITTNPTTGEAGDIYIDESTGDIYTYNITTGEWENQSVTLANNGLTVNSDNTVQLGGTLIQPTTLATDATNTLALTGLEDADTTTGDFDLMVVNNTDGVVQKTPISSFHIRQYVSKYMAADGDIDFATPQTILDLDNIDVYRNGVRVDFTQVDTNTIKLDLGTLAGCYAGDEIRIVQLQ